MIIDFKAIASIKTARRVHTALMQRLVQQVGQKQAEHYDWMCANSTQFKANGLAWWRDRCRGAAQNIIGSGSRVSHFIPPSEETLLWGGFLGGETVVYNDPYKAADLAKEVEELVGRAL